MEFKVHNTDIEMVPGDRITISVGILHKCDIEVQKNGDIRIYYEGGQSLKI